MAEPDLTPPTPRAADAATAAPVSAPPTATSAAPVPRGAALTWAALALAVASLATAGLLWQRLGKTEEAMVRRSTDTLAEAASARTLASQSDAQSKELQARLGVAEIRLSEVTLQRSQLEELMLSVSRSRDDSLVQDLESAIRLAVQQSQLTGSSQPLISALQGAEQRIVRAAQPRLNPVQRAIARDVERLRAASLVDVPALANRLDEMVRNLGDLPLRNAVGATPAPAKAATLATPAKAAPTAAPVAAVGEDTRSGLAQAWEGFNTWRSATAARWWTQFRQGTADLVRISRIDQPDAALLAPEQSYYLRENIKLMLLNARFGLFARQFDTARADVQSVQQLLERYFDTQAPATRLAVQTLTQLHQDLRQEDLPRPDETLSALAVAASGR